MSKPQTITTLLRTGLMIVTLLFSMSALSLSLQEAKDQGLVGEQPNGYLGVVGNSSSAITALISDINGKRRAVYEGIAQKTQTPVDAIEKLAGQKAIQKTASGHYIKLNDRWAIVE